MEKNLKDLDFKEKVDFLKKVLTDENIEDETILLNLYLLVKKTNNYDDSFFKHPKVIFKDILEYMDILYEIQEELAVFIRKLLSIYISCIENCNPNSTVVLTKMPKTFLNLFTLLDCITLSNLINTYGYERLTGTVYEESLGVVSVLSNKLSIFDNFLENISPNSSESLKQGSEEISKKTE